jgi:uncharacterized membrane protein YhaH (DUF805 family)
MSFQEAVRTVLQQKYADFSGRARRSEYWWFVLAQGLIILVPYILFIIGAAAQKTALTVIFGLLLAVVVLGLLVPGLAVTVRRLHDTNRSGWWYLLAFVPFGSLVVLVFTILEGTPGPNNYGPSPKGIGAGYGGPAGGQAYGQPAYGQPPAYGQDAYGQNAGYPAQGGYSPEPGYAAPPATPNYPPQAPPQQY